MALNRVQKDHINGAVRPHMETLVRILHELDTFVADHDALQGSGDALEVNGTVMNDGDGDNPRTDAPQLSGAQIKTLRDLSAAMSLEVNAATKAVLVGKMVRPLSAVLRLQ